MKCPFCSHRDSRVVDSRSVEDGSSIRRRRELFDSKKLLGGLLKAFEKRPIAYEKVQEIAEKIERELRMRGESEVNSTVIGEIVMKYLEQTDQIAYVRFASVYRQFADVNNFMQELQRIMSKNNLNDQTENK